MWRMPNAADTTERKRIVCVESGLADLVTESGAVGFFGGGVGEAV